MGAETEFLHIESETVLKHENISIGSFDLELLPCNFLIEIECFYEFIEQIFLRFQTNKLMCALAGHCLPTKDVFAPRYFRPKIFWVQDILGIWVNGISQDI